ncbi:MAG: arginase family protein, partial [Polymorphobacter sp.]
MRRIALIGLPSDANSSFLAGSAAAPAAIRAALFSPHGNGAAENGFDLGREIVIDDHGDVPLSNRLADNAADDAMIGAAV